MDGLPWQPGAPTRQPLSIICVDVLVEPLSRTGTEQASSLLECSRTPSAAGRAPQALVSGAGDGSAANLCSKCRSASSKFGR